MIYGLLEAGALARVCYHAQELSCLAAQSHINVREVKRVKKDLDDAFTDLLLPVTEESNARPN